MNHIRLSQLLYSMLLLALAACAPATSVAPTPTLTPPVAKVIAEWKINIPTDIVFGFGSVWVPGHRDPNATIRIDPVSNKLIAAIDGTGKQASSAVVTANAVWVAGQTDDLAPIDPKTNMIGTKVPGDHTAITYGFNSIWAVGHQGDPLDRIDPTTSKIIASIPLRDTISDRSNENDVLVASSAVWVIANTELIKVDPSTNGIAFRTTFDKVIAQAKAQTTMPSGKGTDFMWYPVIDPDNPQGCGLLRIDPVTGAGLTFRSVGVDCNPVASTAITDTAVWLSGNSQIDRFNLTTNQIDRTYTVQPGIWKVAIGFGSIWVVSEGLGFVQRLDVAP
jgi:hypothetical protein